MHQPFSTTHVPWRARLPWLPGTRNRRFRRLERSQPVPSTGKPNGELGTAVLFESGTTSSNPSSSTGESTANLSFRVGIASMTFEAYHSKLDRAQWGLVEVAQRRELSFDPVGFQGSAPPTSSIARPDA